MTNVLAEQPAKVKMSRCNKTRILIVEDDTLFLWALNHFLKREGYEVCPVTSGELAFDMLQKQPFDIVISDFHHSGLNGKEIIKKVNDIRPEAKTILISAYQREELGDEQGMHLNAFLNKPIELDMLKVVLRNL